MSRPGARTALVRALRTVPGYRQIRGRIVLRLRHSVTARRVARGIYPDLLDPSQAMAQATVQIAKEHRAAQVRMDELGERHTAQIAQTKLDFRTSQYLQRRAIPPVSAGDLVAGRYLGDRPLIVFDVRGRDEATSGPTLEEIALEQVMGCAFRPMFVSDLTDVSIWRRYGHLCEQMPSEQAWRGTTSHQEYVAARMESFRSDLGAGWILRVPPTGLTAGLRAFVQRCGR